MEITFDFHAAFSGSLLQYRSSFGRNLFSDSIAGDNHHPPAHD